MFSALIEKLQRRQDLTLEEAAAAMGEIMEGRAQPAQIAGLLVGLSMKGERPSEIVGLAQTMRSRATRLSRTHAPVFDTCGTGGDRSHTFNVSTVAALALAACGVRVAKHGNRSVSSTCGSADLFEALGVRISAEPAVVERCLDEAGIAFGGQVVRASQLMHGKVSSIQHDGRGVFQGVSQPFTAGRYHSLVVAEPLPDVLEIAARTDDGTIMGVRHRTFPVHGVQFHPESVLTGEGKQILRNFLGL